MITPTELIGLTKIDIFEMISRKSDIFVAFFGLNNTSLNTLSASVALL